LFCGGCGGVGGVIGGLVGVCVVVLSVVEVCVEGTFSSPDFSQAIMSHRKATKDTNLFIIFFLNVLRLQR